MERYKRCLFLSGFESWTAEGTSIMPTVLTETPESSKCVCGVNANTQHTVYYTFRIVSILCLKTV